MPKTSQAVIKPARLNPKNPHEREVLRILGEKEKQGYNFKQVAVDAILRAEGCTPEMFDKEPVGDIFSLIKEAIAEAIPAALRHYSGLRMQQSPDAPEEEIDESVSEFSKSFATSYLQRRESLVGQPDDEDE